MFIKAVLLWFLKSSFVNDMGKGKTSIYIEKMLSFSRENPGKEYNYKQIAAVLNLRDARKK